MGSFEEIATHRAGVLESGEASDPDYVVVRDGDDLERLCEDVAGDRDYPIVGLTLRECSEEPVLRASDIRGVVGPGVRIYLIASEELLHGLRELLGSRLRVWRGVVRVWWPGASSCADPADHPVVVGLEDEDYRVTLEEFAAEFELSRPRVRERVRLIEDSRALLVRELSIAQEQSHKVHERLRDSQIECHRLRTRAETAEASIEAAERSPHPE
ncbi:MAG: hypothetical protein ACYDHN_09645 [Solirubrobacteraceae bacterium]